MPPVSFSFTFEGLEFTQRAISAATTAENGMVARDLKRRGRLVMFAAKRQVGVDTRELRRSINMTFHRFGALPEVHVGSKNEIALLHHEGTRPHAINARNGGMLRYSKRGRVYYSRSVNHPGTRPNRYLSDNLYLAGG